MGWPIGCSCTKAKFVTFSVIADHQNTVGDNFDSVVDDLNAADETETHEETKKSSDL